MNEDDLLDMQDDEFPDMQDMRFYMRDESPEVYVFEWRGNKIALTRREAEYLHGLMDDMLWK